MPAEMRKISLLVFTFSLLASRVVCGGKHFIKTQFKSSPFGIGIRNALSESGQFSSWKQRNKAKEQNSKISLSSNQNSDRHSRFASILGSEQETLGLALAPHLKPRPKDSSKTELDYIEEELTHCSSTPQSLHRQNRRGILHLPVSDEDEDFDVVEVTGAGRRSAAVNNANNPRTTVQTSDTRGGNAMIAVRPLLFWENMVSGAVSRSVAQTIMHPANTMKTILQSARGADRPTLGSLMQPKMFRTLTRGAGANFLLSVPHGAVNFAVLEYVRGHLNRVVESVPFLAARAQSMGPGLDFMSSAISTICCSVVSTPQMMITDNIMAGNYPRLDAAIAGLYKDRGIMGFYAGWWPGLVGKIPSYALTWTFFQQLKRIRTYVSDEPIKNIENTVMGCMASATTVCIMIPLDTIKTRLVTQMSATAASGVPYKGIVDCAVRITREEGIKTFYRGLAPRLISVVPMIGIQFGVYEAMKKVMLNSNKPKVTRTESKGVTTVEYGDEEALEETAMEVAADPSNPFPAPHVLKHIAKTKKSLRSFGTSRRVQISR